MLPFDVFVFIQKVKYIRAIYLPKDNDDQRTMRFYKAKLFWPLMYEAEFSQAQGLHWKTELLGLSFQTASYKK